jgi:formylglycine-generating enzyme required for sulfatase activity
MAGNAHEWAADWYDADYYTGSPVQNPQGPESGNRRVLRGGAVSGDERMVRCANRFRESPGYPGGNTGIRVVVAPGDG